MSDRPLFENADEQEAVYAPQQLPDAVAAERERAADNHGEMQQDTGPVTLPIGAAGVSASGAGFAGNTVSDVAGGTTLPLDEPVDDTTEGDATNT